MLHHNRASFRALIRPSQGEDRGATSSLFRADVDEQDLVLVEVDDFAESRPQLDERTMRELAPKHGELNVLPVAFHEPVDLAKPLAIADVIRDDVRLTHDRPSARSECGVFVDLTQETAGEKPRLNLQHAPVANSVTEYGVSDELLHPAFVREKQAASRGGAHRDPGWVHREVFGAEAAAVDDADDDRIGDEWPELLHEVERQGGTPEAWLMIKAEERIESDR
jgi:hypothetical protein